MNLSYDNTTKIIKVEEVILWRTITVKTLNIDLKLVINNFNSQEDVSVYNAIKTEYADGIPISDEGLGVVLLPEYLKYQLYPELLNTTKFNLINTAVKNELFDIRLKDLTTSKSKSVTLNEIEQTWKATLNTKEYLVYKDLLVSTNHLDALALIKLELEYNL